MSIGDRLKQLRTEAGLTQEQMGAVVGTTKQYVSQLEKGANQTPNGQFLEGWARRFAVSIQWLATGQGPREPSTGEPDWTDVVGYQAAVSLGDGAANEEWQEAHKLKFRASSLRRQGLYPGNLQVFYGRGDSMEPRIHDGDAILVDRSDVRPVDDAIYMLENEDGAYAKRLSMIDGRWFVVSENVNDPKWRKPVALEGRKPFKILGRVRWVGSWVK